MKMQDRRVIGDSFAASEMSKLGRSKAFFASEVLPIIAAIIIGTVKQKPMKYAEKRRRTLTAVDVYAGKGRCGPWKAPKHRTGLCPRSSAYFRGHNPRENSGFSLFSEQLTVPGFPKIV
jgi:hypothetical protein